MRNWIILVVLLVTASVAGTLAVQYLPGGSASSSDIPLVVSRSKPSTGAQPKAVLYEPYEYKFGTLPQRSTGKHEWTVKNEGTADLELWQISATCSCTIAKFSDGEKAVIKPGQSDKIVLEYETRENNGDYSKGAEIGTNDPNLQSFSLTARGKVYPPVQTFPPEPSIPFGTISNDNGDSVGAFIVYSQDRPETKVVKVSAGTPEITGEVTAPTEEEVKRLELNGVKKSTKVTIHIKPGLPLGAFREEVLVKTDHPKQPELRFMVSGKMSGPISLMPSGLSMHDVYGKAGATGEINVMVANKRATTFEVVKKPAKLKVEVVASDPVKLPGRYRLIVSVPPNSPPERFEDEIVLKTDHPRAATVIVPVSIWVVNSE